MDMESTFSIDKNQKYNKYSIYQAHIFFFIWITSFMYYNLNKLDELVLFIIYEKVTIITPYGKKI